jgi:uncharacterized protein
MTKIKQIGKGLLVLIIYFILSELIVLPLILLRIDYQNLDEYIKTIYIIAYQLLILGLIIAVYRKELVVSLEDLKKNHKQYFDQYLKYWFLAFGLMAVANIIISFFVEGQPSNQEAIVKIFESSPMYVFFTAVIMAPLLEELVFRFSLRNIFGKNWVFIIISGLLFGFIHIMGATNFMEELVFLIPYSIPGFVFAYVLVKSDNIFVPIGLHFIHNGFLVAMQFLAMFLV